ncbi:glutathione S-transferase-like protein [Cordyceps fumosorosea ARSEF 2679]|uniref:Glutathione S-transferase-like protein n=1 Tax=Cordyceps fumosorosea (strain ARSEF 2679) TaxID=1081104 RepID=A0A167PLT0_CORFA|nr:glutathione S-transferase-like protein [Cordyceps fumosorosea ARSEF 2679]OAA56793.1 glutathione S-transferase-like protein [Cordyceps fumosorosea ARSEF 2679]
MSYSLYIGNKRYSSWSMRPWVLFTAVGVPFDEKLHIFQPTQRQPEFIAFSPTAKVPCLHDTSSSSSSPVVVWDSLAICEYVAETHPAVWPADRAARAFARSAAAEMHAGFPAVRDQCSMNVGLRIEFGPVGADLQAELDRMAALFVEGLERFGGPWIAGPSFSAADAFFAPIASRLKTYGLAIPGKAGEYVDRLFEHPAVQRWVKEGIAEDSREPFHEEDCVRGRKILQDLQHSS